MHRAKKLTLFFGIILVILLIPFVVISQHCVLPILMYHSINPGTQVRCKLEVSVSTFQRQMDFLKDHNYRVLRLEEAANLIKNKKRIPLKSVVITFDDGFKDNYLYAYPVLKKYNFPATIFIIVDDIGKSGVLNLDEILTMQKSGLITFGSHTLKGDDLLKVATDEELRRQIFDSKKILEDKLKQAVNCFSYPVGLFNPKIKQMVKEAGYQIAVATSPGKRSRNDDLFALKRLRISENAKNLFVFWVESSGYYNFLRENRHK